MTRGALHRTALRATQHCTLHTTYHTLTHVSFILECVIAIVSSAVEVRCLLPIKSARLEHTVFGGAESLEAFLNDGRVFAVIICVHLHIRCTNVDLIRRVSN